MVQREQKLGGVKIYNRRRGFPVAPPGAFYVGRPTVCGNPFVVGVHGDQEECVRLFDHWLDTGDNRYRIIVAGEEIIRANGEATESKRQRILEIIPSLAGKDLICYCWPNPCHAEPIAWRANGTKETKLEA